jgi:site-specific recombinase XerD
MAKFSSFERQGARQAASMMKEMQGKEIVSVGTVRNYEQALSQFGAYLASQGLHIRDIGEKEAINYLEQRAEEVGQKTLDLDRQAIQAALMHTGAIQERLAVIKSEHQQVLEARAYTSEQVSMIAERQTEKHALATEIAHAAGLRAHELITLAPASERPADERPALESKFEGREGVLYTVEGKGGLCREVMLPKDLADRLEARRFDEPKQVTDRGVHYEQRYDIGAGKQFTDSFSKASDRALDWSTGAHGLRHSYAQERMDELQKMGYDRETALETASQEMGHFRPDITEVYLR